MNKKLIAIAAIIIIIIAIGVTVYSLTGDGEENLPSPTPSEQETVLPSEEETPSEPETTVSEELEASSDVSEPEVSEDENEVVAEVELPLTGLIIGIDPGHQGKGNSEQEAAAPGSSETTARDTGGTRGTTTGITEYDLNLAVSLMLQQKLTALGAEVIMTRTTNDVDISNIERATMMNDAGADLWIRIHANGSENPSVKGAMMLIPGGSYTTSINEASRTAGEIIFQSYLAATGAENDGVIEQDLTGFNWSTVPVCLIELGYMTNPDEDMLMATDEYRNICAQGLSDGIVAWAAVK